MACAILRFEKDSNVLQLIWFQQCLKIVQIVWFSVRLKCWMSCSSTIRDFSTVSSSIRFQRMSHFKWYRSSSVLKFRFTLEHHKNAWNYKIFIQYAQKVNMHIFEHDDTVCSSSFSSSMNWCLAHNAIKGTQFLRQSNKITFISLFCFFFARRIFVCVFLAL